MLDALERILKGLKPAGRSVLVRALIEISLSRFYYPGMDAVAHPRRIGAAAGPALRINLPVFVAAIKGSSSPDCIQRGLSRARAPGDAL